MFQQLCHRPQILADMEEEFSVSVA